MIITIIDIIIAQSFSYNKTVQCPAAVSSIWSTLLTTDQAMALDTITVIKKNCSWNRVNWSY